MSAGWNIISPRWLFTLVIAFALGGFCIYRGNQYTSAVPTERTTTTYYIYIQYHTSFYRISKYYTCNYNFNVDGKSYSGNMDCSQQGAYDSIKAKLSNTVRVLPIPNATVYYDPANPSLNSLTEFSARSKFEYRGAIGGIGIGLFICLPLVFVAALEATKNKRNRRQYVDSRGTVIDTEDIDFSSVFDGLPGGRGMGEESYAANGKAAKTSDFASSLGLRELYLDVVKQIHPDHASNEADRALRERLTKEANVAFERGDDATLRRVLEEYMSTISTVTCQNTIQSDSPNLVRGSQP